MAGFDWTVPCAVAADGGLIANHGRILAAAPACRHRERNEGVGNAEFWAHSCSNRMGNQKSMSDMTRPVAVLVDGDNISGKNAAPILGIAMKHGDPIVVRAYLDAQQASCWHGAIGYRLIHAGSGKNATDVLLTIDAMDLVHAKTAMHFVIATSDGDFTHLAVRLRELGANVIGVGEAKAPRKFRASCSSFVELDAQPAVKLVPKAPTGVTELDLKIRAMIAQHSKKGEGMRIASLAPRMHVEHGIKISALRERNWRSYLSARPGLFDLDPRGPEAMVRFRPQGFVAAA
jgi:uncharacterized LabA/DUF88 family protein